VTPPSPTPGASRARLALAGIGFVVCLLALPVVLVLDGTIGGWVLGLVLWTVNWTVMILVGRVAAAAESPVMAVGLAGITSMGRAFAIFLVLMLVGLKVSREAALTAGGVFIAAFTFDLIARTATFQMTKSATKEDAPS